MTDLVALGIRKTIDALVVLALGRHGRQSSAVQGLAMAILAGAPTVPPEKAIWDWVGEHVAYQVDPIREWLFTPEEMAIEFTLKGRCFGDAPDSAALTAALCLAAGLDAQYVAVGFDGRPVSYVFARGKKREDAWGDPELGWPLLELRATSLVTFPVEERERG
jgi:hypothetical protein